MKRRGEKKKKRKNWKKVLTKEERRGILTKLSPQ